MPAPIENAIRREIVQRHEKGESLRSISDEMRMSYETVKHIWQHWRENGKVEPNYEQAKQRGTRQYPELCRAAIALKKAHPRWGAPLILLELRRTIPQAKYPSARTLQRWFREYGVDRHATKRQSKALRVQRGQNAHDVWAVDAKERIRLGDGTEVCWLTITDEGSGAILHIEVFPPEELVPSGGASGAE